MGEHRARAEQARVAEHLDRRAPVAGPDLVQLGGRLAGVDVHATAGGRGELADGDELRLVEEVRAVRAQPAGAGRAWPPAARRPTPDGRRSGGDRRRGTRRTPGPSRRRSPVGRTATPAASGKKYMSRAVVMPASRHSAAPSAAPAATVSAASTAPSAGSRRPRKRSRSTSSARPRNIVIARWVWALTSPGTTIPPRPSMIRVAAGGWSPAGSDARDRCRRRPGSWRPRGSCRRRPSTRRWRRRRRGRRGGPVTATAAAGCRAAAPRRGRRRRRPPRSPRRRRAAPG